MWKIGPLLTALYLPVDALDAARLPGGLVDVDEDGVELEDAAVLGDGETVRELVEEAGENRSTSSPMTESRAPTMPTSQTKAVPLGRMRASAVPTCVCVPTTAVTRPSRYQPMATFSLVASACMSTMTADLAGSCVEQRRRRERGSRCRTMKVRPWRLMTVTPVAGHDAAAGRPGGSSAGAGWARPRSRWGMISFWSQMWLPEVMTSTPASNSSRAVARVRPRPAAAFSPLAMTRSTPSSRRRPGKQRRHRPPARPADDVADHEDLHGASSRT